MKMPVIVCVPLVLAAFSCKPKSEADGGEAGPAAAETPDGYILATAKFLPPVGTKLEWKESTTMDGGSMTIEVQGQTMEGTSDIKESKTSELEILAEDKVRYLVSQSEESQKAVINGQEMPQQGKENALVGIPVIATLVDGEWSIEREDGEEANGAQEEEIAELVEKFNTEDDVKIYGTEPRKPGDSWTVDMAGLTFLNELQDGSGEIQLTFDKVDTHEGMECAFLSGTMTMSGRPEEMAEGELSIETKALVIRSLELQEDLKADFDGEMKMEMTIPGGTMNMAGEMKIRSSAAVK